MMKRFGWLVLSGLILAGCNNGNQAAKNVAPQPEPDKNMAASPDENSSNVSGTEPGKESAPTAKPNPDTKTADRGTLDSKPLPVTIKVPPVVIRTDDKTWSKTNGAPKSGKPATAAELAKKMDASLASLKNAWVTAKISYDIPSVGKLTGHADIKIEDKDTFLIDYYIPSTQGGMNRMVSQDGKTAYMRAGEWVSKKPPVKVEKVATDDSVKAWEESFSEQMFAGFMTGQDAWAPIVDGWQKGKGGYKLTMEEKTLKEKGQDRTYYRLLATRKGQGEATVEVQVDGKKFVPLTVRVLRTNKDGSKESLYWNSAWRSGGSFKKSDFKVPDLKS